jgi:FkbM family methyltransferase
MIKIIKKAWRSVAVRPSFRKINELMFDCSLSGLGILNYESHYISGERHFVERLLPLYISEGKSIMVDVGAYIGSYTKLLISSQPNALIWAFEPNPKTCAILERELNALNVVVVNKGLGASETILKFYDRKDCEGSSQHGSLYRDVIENIHHAESVELEVPITTLDSFASENGIDHINLLKIDTEGHDLEVLKGGAGLLKEEKVDLLQIEFNEMNIVSHVFFRDIRNFLPDHIPYRLLSRGVIPLTESPLRTELFAFQNIVFVHRKFKPNKAMVPTVKRGSSS